MGLWPLHVEGLNSVTQSCPTPIPNTGPSGVAVDVNGDLFVLYSGTGASAIVEYAGGLKGCNATILGVPISTQGLLAIDASGDLIYSDSVAGVVDVIDPPYTAVSRTIGSGFSPFGPWGVSVNKKNKLAFVADLVNATVTVVNYQTGANVTVLGAEHGISSAWGVVDGPNAVY